MAGKQGASPKTNIAVDAVLNNKVRVTKVHSNFDQEIIVVTEDKVRLCLKDKIDAIRRRHSWHTPAGILITIVLAATTSKFHELWGFPADGWKGIFIAAGVGTGVWLLVTLFRSIRHEPSVDDILIELKRETPRVDLDAIRYYLRDGVWVDEVSRSESAEIKSSSTHVPVEVNEDGTDAR